MDVLKILVVGDPKTGKSTLIQNILQSGGGNNTSVSQKRKDESCSTLMQHSHNKTMESSTLVQ